MSTGPDAVAAMRTMLAQGLGTPLFIDDVPNHLHRLAEQMKGAARISDAMAQHPTFMAEHSARADTMRHAAMMVQALGLNIRAALDVLADEHALHAELQAVETGHPSLQEPDEPFTPQPFRAVCCACEDEEWCLPDDAHDPVCRECWGTWADSDEPWGGAK